MRTLLAKITPVNTTISDVMRSPVMTLTPHQSVGHARDLMKEHKVSAFPVVTPEGELVGVVTASDLIDDHADETPVGTFAKKSVFTVHPEDGPHVAARIMRNHGLHHVIVVESGEGKGDSVKGASVTGMVSSFDLLRLVEDHRFVMKNAPTPSKKGNSRT
jgi:CBS domain-containing protein